MAGTEFFGIFNEQETFLFIVFKKYSEVFFVQEYLSIFVKLMEAIGSFSLVKFRVLPNCLSLMRESCLLKLGDLKAL